MRTLVRPSALAAAGLIGGFAVARTTGQRQLGGALFAVAGLGAARGWLAAAGPARTAALSGLYLAAMGGSHPLAKKLGAWPAVLAVSAGTVAAAEAFGRS